MNPTENETKSDSPVYTFQKNASERIEARLTEFHGRRLVDLRTYYETGGGEWRPTKKGVCVGVNLLGELEKAVAALREMVGTDADDEAGEG